MTPVVPNPHSEARKRSEFSFREQVTREPSANSRDKARTFVEITPKLTPDPWVAVVTTPAKVCSDIDPILDIARLFFANSM